MATFAVSQVILIPFPFSDLSARKLRPALILADAGRGDWVLCQITSNPYADTNAIAIDENDFERGGLQRISYARAGKLFTANESLFQSGVGLLSPQRHRQVVQTIIALLQSPNVAVELR